jgi:hypothetical protein
MNESSSRLAYRYFSFNYSYSLKGTGGFSSAYLGLAILRRGAWLKMLDGTELLLKRFTNGWTGLLYTSPNLMELDRTAANSASSLFGICSEFKLFIVNDYGFGSNQPYLIILVKA